MPVAVSTTISAQEQNKILELREMEIALGPEIEQRIHDKLDSGAYDSVNALTTDALELLENRDAALRMDVESVREAVQQGIYDIDAGKGIDGHALFENLIRRGRDATGCATCSSRQPRGAMSRRHLSLLPGAILTLL